MATCRWPIRAAMQICDTWLTGVNFKIYSACEVLSYSFWTLNEHLWILCAKRNHLDILMQVLRLSREWRFKLRYHKPKKHQLVVRDSVDQIHVHVLKYTHNRGFWLIQSQVTHTNFFLLYAKKLHLQSLISHIT